MTKTKHPKPIRIENYNGIWSIWHSPIHAPKPLQDKNGEPIRSYPDKVFEFVCSDRSALAYLADQGFTDEAEEFVRKVGGTHYASTGFGYLQVFRLKDGETATEGNWSKTLTEQDVELLIPEDRLILHIAGGVRELKQSSYGQMENYFARFNLYDGKVCTFVRKETVKKGSSQPQGYCIHVKEQIGDPKVPYPYYDATNGLEAKLAERR